MLKRQTRLPECENKLGTRIAATFTICMTLFVTIDYIDGVFKRTDTSLRVVQNQLEDLRRYQIETLARVHALEASCERR